MMLKPRRNFFFPSNFQSTTAAQLGTSQYTAIDRTWPVEEIHIICDVTCGATGPTPYGPSNSPTTIPQLDSLLNLVKRINLTVNDGVQPRTIVDVSGIGMLEYCGLVDDALDRSTLDHIGQVVQGAALANNLKYRICYRVPLIHPLATEPLRTRMLLPVHTFPQDPVLRLDFETSANMMSAGSIAALNVSYVLHRREMSVPTTAAIQQKGGFIGFDLLETTFNVGTGTSGELRFALPVPGNYANLLFRQYLGGANPSRSPIDQTTTFGSEQRWRIESGNVVPQEWRWKQLQIQNDFRTVRQGLFDSAVFVASTSAGSPTKNVAAYPVANPPSNPAAGQRWDPEASCIIDFVSPDGDSFNELGSTLDCNLPTNTGLKMEVVGSVASVATNGSVLYVIGHRYFGDLSPYQAQTF